MLKRTLIFWILFLGVVSDAWSLSYKVGPGDMLQIQVWGETEFSGTFQINPEGQIDYPYLHKVTVGGLTVEQIDALLTDTLKAGFLKDPQVNILIKDYQSQRVLVLGSVMRPGRYVLSEETRLLDLLSLAGGLSGAGGKRILLFREKDKETDKKNPELPVAVSSSPSLAVQVPAPTPLQMPSSVLAQLPSSGVNIEALSATLPNMTPVVVDYFGLVHDGKMDQNLILKDGDIINVPKANEVFVLGNVAKPGPIKYEDKMTLLQAVTLSGGPTTTASTKSTYILRHSPQGEQKISVRLDKILESKAPNFTLEADDVVIIPESFF